MGTIAYTNAEEFSVMLIYTDKMNALMLDGLYVINVTGNVDEWYGDLPINATSANIMIQLDNKDDLRMLLRSSAIRINLHSMERDDVIKLADQLIDWGKDVWVKWPDGRYAPYDFTYKLKTMSHTPRFDH